jgi:hypothetical protein
MLDETLKPSSELSFSQLKEKEWLEEVAKHLKECPVCGASNTLKAKGRFIKNIVCSNCKATFEVATVVNYWKTKWGYEKEGRHGLKLQLAKDKYPVGRFLEGKTFPVEWWLHPNKPYEKYVRYAGALLKMVEKVNHWASILNRGRAPGYVGKVEIKDQSKLRLLGPDDDCVAETFPYRDEKGDDTVIVIVDYTPKMWGNDEKMIKNDFFCFLVSLLFHRLCEYLKKQGETPEIYTFLVGYGERKGQPWKQDSNTFYPFEPRKVLISERVKNWLDSKGLTNATEIADWFFPLNDERQSG